VDEGPRNVILTAGGWDSADDARILTCDESGRLVELTPDLPVARLIASVPQLVAIVRRLIDGGETMSGSAFEQLLEDAEEALGDAESADGVDLREV
jgi:hypothetical protein